MCPLLYEQREVPKGESEGYTLAPGYIYTESDNSVHCCVTRAADSQSQVGPTVPVRPLGSWGPAPPPLGWAL